MQNRKYENTCNKDFDEKESVNKDLDAYDLIYQFINTEIMSKYECLTECYFKREGEGFFKEYYLRHDGSVSDSWGLRFKIKREIEEYCIKNDIEKEFDEILVMVVTKVSNNVI